jgi:hypothetical protein
MSQALARRRTEIEHFISLIKRSRDEAVHPDIIAQCDEDLEETHQWLKSVELCEVEGCIPYELGEGSRTYGCRRCGATW